MSILKKVTYDQGTNSIEATWVDKVDSEEVVVRCHSYADVQMDMFRSDVTIYGGNISDYAEMIAEVEAKIVPYVPPILTDAELKAEAERIKEETLARLTVKVASGKVFYADLASKVDIEAAIRNAKDKNIPQTEWKLAEAINGSKYVIVTLEELEEASYLALQTKASLVGIGA